MQPQFMQSRAHAIVVVLTATIFLSACGSKPETSDISAQLIPRIKCNQLVIKDVKKTDGMEAQNKTYQVAYTFAAEFRGGKVGAADFLSKVMNLVYPNTIYNSHLLDCDADVAQGWLQHIIMQAEQNLAKGPGPIPIPYALELQGNAMMKKAESGWVFTDMDAPQVIKVIQSEPLEFSRPKPQIPAVGSSSPSSTDSGKSAGATPSSDSQACLDKKIAESRNSKETQEFKKQSGVEPRIPNEVFEEWQASCGVVAAK